MRRAYEETDKMCDVIQDEFRLLGVLARFGIRLGFGDKTVKELCDESGVDTRTFLVVANFVRYPDDGPDAEDAENVSVASLVNYLRRAHSFYLDTQIPVIRRKLISALDCAPENEVSFLILRYFDKYISEVRKHMELEDKVVFSYVLRLLAGKRSPDYEIALFTKMHDEMQDSFGELKEIILRYHNPEGDADALLGVLLDIFNFTEDIRHHCRVEDAIFVPAVQRLEEQMAVTGEKGSETRVGGSAQGSLSEREQDIVKDVVMGLTNKEIADKRFISVNTVLTHRKNISRKLSIHSAAGLTIYAIVNHLVDINEIELN